jgi:hypothetical protein
LFSFQRAYSSGVISPAKTEETKNRKAKTNLSEKEIIFFMAGLLFFKKNLKV